MSAQSCDSVPPAPGWMVTIALRPSFSPGQQAFGFQAINQIPQPVNLAPQVGFNVFPFAAQVEIGGDVVAAAHQVSLGRQHIFQALSSGA